MASSRWKRFAFFDRHTLTLPPEVLEDLIPSDASVAGSTTRRGGSGASGGGGSDGSGTNERQEQQPPQRPSLRTLHHLADAAGTNDTVSLVVTTASLPITSKPSGIAVGGGGASPAKGASSSRVATQQQQQQKRSASSADNDSTLEAFWSSLTACTAPLGATDATATTALTNKKKNSADQKASIIGEQQQPQVVQLPSQGQQRSSSDNINDPLLTAAPTATTAESLDGLVLVFCTSRETDLVHCLDLTVRCNPPPSQPTPSTSGSTTTSSAAGGGGTTTAPSAAAAEWEDLDGWRGYFAPFPSSSSSTTSRSNDPNGTDGRSVVGLATCRILPTSSGGSSRSSAKHTPVHLACISNKSVVVWQDAHLYLSCRRPITSPQYSSITSHPPPKIYALPQPIHDGNCRVVDIIPGLVAVGTDTATVLIFAYNPDARVSATSTGTATSSGSGSGGGGTGTGTHLRLYLRIPPPPPSSDVGMEIVSVKLSRNVSEQRGSIFVAYRPANANTNNPTTTSNISSNASTTGTSGGSSTAAGVCCYDFPLPSSPASSLSAPSARHDLDGRFVGSSCLVDACTINTNAFSSVAAAAGGGGELQLTVARPDGLYSYSRTERTGVAPIDGTKLAICLVPPPIPAERAREINAVHQQQAAQGYALVASTDAKSGRDAVDIYDSTNKLVAFHLLLSPGHKAVQAAGTTTFPTISGDGSIRGGRSSAVVLTSGGSVVTLTEKLTAEKISLLVQKNLYSAAIVVAYADPSYEAASITNLYRQYAEHLYRKGDFSGAIEQYCHTIGSLESSHVIFRYLDAPKIPLLVKYLERLRSRDMATPVHNELLRTCYLKLNDTEAADAIAASASSNKASMSSILSNLANNPKDALATICSLDHAQAAETLVMHGPSLARALPRETAGVVMALCLGTYSPKALAEAALIDSTALRKMMEHGTDDQPRLHEPYPFQLFASAFVENPKMLRMILTHCNRNRCYLTPSLRRTLLELTLAEWNQAKRVGDMEAEKMRHKEAIAALTDSHCREIGDYDALVIVQLAGFEEGELLLYERLQMTPMLLERYAKDGSEKSRRQMLALCQADPEILADVLGHFVDIASEKLEQGENLSENDDEDSEDDEVEEILEDIREALALARRQGVLAPARIARILAGEGTGQFSGDAPVTNQRRTVPLSVALDYVGTILDESRREVGRLRSEVEEYNQICNSMEQEIDSLLRASHVLPPAPESSSGIASARLNIDELFAKVLSADTDIMGGGEPVTEQPREEFWRDMNQSEDTFDTIARYFAKGVI